MPTIDLNSSDLSAHVLSVMCFPADPELREAYHARLSAQAAIYRLSATDTVQLHAGLVHTLLDGPSRAQFRAKAAEATRQRTVAGEILAAIYLMARFELDPEPSMNKALHVMEEHGIRTKYGDGQSRHTSERKIRRSWNSFKSVAHLWGAFRINRAYPFCEERAVFASREDTVRLLEVAAQLLQFGTAFVPKRARPPEPILNSQECWVIPVGIKPDPLENVTNPDLLLNYLSSYEAPPSAL